MQEKIIVGVSKVYFGHIKATTQSDTILEFKATMTHILFYTGYSLQDWKVAVNSMITKKGKGNLVKDLCTINLIEADFNFNNKRLARLTINCIEKNRLIPKEQYGNRKLHKAVYQVANKRLVYDLAQL